MDFQKRYNNLNIAQKQAVDAIDGPIMVIAGPGTGKTELISVRVANILQKTDTLPENILCLTFTDSGANAMRQRLTEIIGKDAYKVAVHTFHSFGTEVINQNGQYFYNGAVFKPSDNIAGYEVLKNIFEKLEYNNPVISQMNGEYTHIDDALQVISEIKKSGLSVEELLKVLDDNDEIIFSIEKLLAPVFVNRPNKQTAIDAASHISNIAKLETATMPDGVVSLAKIMADSLAIATDTAIFTGKTPAITKWRNEWFEKDMTDNFVLKSRNRQIKLRAIVHILDEYLKQMQKSGLYDFDDMILQVVQAIENNDDLRFNLQEKYQYIMVDEFQDTNMAQMRILHNLTNNIAISDTPNIMVVGDDDQAIYSFQGADLSNILEFASRYPKTKLITLTENYRSCSKILENSRNVITQGSDRLENTNDKIIKKLNANNKSTGSIGLNCAESIIDERLWVAKEVQALLKTGKKPNNIAVITRHHNDITELLPYLYHYDISVNYERRDNALQQDIIILIENIAQLLIDISAGDHDKANSKLPEILSHKAWGISPNNIMKLSILSYDNHKRWLDQMAEMSELTAIHDWLVQTAMAINDMTLEKALDVIVGTPASNDDKNINFVSPIYNYYFGNQQLTNNPNDYLTYLESLRAIRSKLRDFHPDEAASLSTFIDFITLNRKVGNVISITRRSTISENAINVMTAHKAKGLEFDTVFVINAVDTVWGEHARSHNRLINYPENLALAPAGETSDERLRLFYVAMTRAKNNLHISYSLQNDNNKLTLLAAFLADAKIDKKMIKAPETTSEFIESAELAWYQDLTDTSSSTIRDLLMPKLQNYKLSVTHLQNFLNVKNGGPQMFLLKNLLQFPQEKSASAAFGTAIHDSLQFAHTNFVATGNNMPITDILSRFNSVLKTQHLSSHDYELMLKRGTDALKAFVGSNHDLYSTDQQIELNFTNQHCIVNEAHLSGKLDLIDIDKDKKLISVTDYKTGKQFYDWKASDDNAKIKLHHYRQQLMFYKLLIENSRDYGKYQVARGIMQFVEPTPTGEILSIDTEFNTDEMNEFKSLINAVWSHIISLDLPDVSQYDQSYKGILAFEQDLVSGL